jgi:tRNA G10  N-methylase Trm11
MAQTYKSVYFPDHPGINAQERNLTIAFGGKDREIFNEIKILTSQEIRERLGHLSFQSLVQAAQEETLPLNTYCVRRLRSKQEDSKGASFSLFPDLDSGIVVRPLIDPILATFRGGEAEPLHRWFPYLEGYSPQFVTKVLQEFAPRAVRILDPFAGTGTTPLTAATMNLEAFYCELNPLLQYLIDAKKIGLTLPTDARSRVINMLQSIARDFKALLNARSQDRLLKETFEEVFSDSEFFDRSTFSEVLRSRALIDDVACQDLVASKLLTVAILSSLIPASRLIRRGDLRYKTAVELSRAQSKFTSAVPEQLALIINDLRSLQPKDVKVSLVSEDARMLDRISPLNIDAVVTSPPYLNGTNYFRNTKVELWFLRSLCTQKDLSDFRYRAVTAGINDVTNGKMATELPPDVQPVVENLSRAAYDPRIPKMVASYFTEMGSIFSGLKRHIRPGGRIIMDIGDSAYGNVHVATDSLLSKILSNCGYRLEREVVLRKRSSRGGFPLKQSLLIFDVPHVARQSIQTYAPQHNWMPSWNNFKRELPHQVGVFAKRNWGHPLHSLCSYQGKMKPSLAYFLVKTFVPKDGRFLDPFAGVGTIPFEGALLGATTHCFEISPAALHISRAKLGTPEPNECERLLVRLEKFIERGVVNDTDLMAARRIRFNGELPEYFSPKTMREILLARKFFAKFPPKTPTESLVVACLLHILHGNRPYALSRRSHPITPFAPTGAAEYRELIGRLRDKVCRSLAVPRREEFRPGTVWNQDATLWWPREIENLDAVITSPPFFDSTRFYLANWMRLWFCGWEAEDFKIRPLAFIDERQKVDFSVYEPILRQARERLKPGGVCVFHLGKSKKCDMADALGKIAATWFKVVDKFSETVDHCESHGIRDKGTVTAHQFLVLQ